MAKGQVAGRWVFKHDADAQCLQPVGISVETGRQISVNASRPVELQ